MIIKKQHFPSLGETLYQKKLTNGLQVSILHKPGYQETLGIIATRFGSLDTYFRPKYRKLMRQFPAGIAHFLEHKVFELANNQDAMLQFSALGAEVNAFTDYQQTVYYFSTCQKVLESLKLLQKFTSSFYISQESLDREQEIIAQEIKMYQDEPDYQLYMGLLSHLYPDTPLAQDIAGSLETIKHITMSELKMNFDLFYQPSNMLLFLATPLDPELLFSEIEKFQSARPSRKIFPIEKEHLLLNPVKPSSSIELQISGPKLALGYRGKVMFTRLSTFAYRLALKLFFAMTIGWTSSTYQEWYEKGWLDDSFFMEIEVTSTYQFIIITLDSPNPIAMSKKLRQFFKDNHKSKDLTKDHLTLAKQEMYGDFLKSMNSLESLAMQYVSAWIDKEELFDLPQILDQLTLEDVIFAGSNFLQNSDTTDFIIFPQ